MSPEEWCIIWIPIIHPGIETPTPGKRSPHGYMKATLATLSYLTGYNERTIEGWFYSKSYHPKGRDFIALLSFNLSIAKFA